MEQQTFSENIRQKKDEEEFKTIYCCCFKIPWFRRKKLSVSSSARSFKNKDLDLSMRMKHALINMID